MPKKKGVIHMKYEKPELVTLGSATDAVQSAGKGNIYTPDLVIDPPNHTNGAYEADE
jgi:hypothetical protein